MTVGSELDHPGTCYKTILNKQVNREIPNQCWTPRMFSKMGNITFIYRWQHADDEQKKTIAFTITDVTRQK